MSYRNDTKPTYDRALLSSVPDPTRAERQEGYNVDLLDEGRDRRAPTPPAPDRQPTDQQPLTEGYSPGAVAFAYKEGQLENGARPGVAKGRWYRTRWGMTAIVIAIVLIIGGIVGGVVGGTHHSSSKNNSGNGQVGSGNPNANSSTIGGESQNSQSHSSSVEPDSGFTPISSVGTSTNPSAVTPTSTSEDSSRGTPNPVNPQPAAPSTGG